MTIESKSLARHRYEQFIYWSSISWDIARPDNHHGFYVLGYIKSGTNWLCHLISDVTGLPDLEPWKLNFTRFTPCIYHTHRFIPIDSVRKRTVYLMRDGRDTIVSAYYHYLRAGGPIFRQLQNEFEYPFTSEYTRENLPYFINFMKSNKSATTDYRSHILKWRKHKDVYVMVKYEDLLLDTKNVVHRIVAELTGNQPNKNVVNRAVEKNDFTKVTKRKKGLEDETSFGRKAISGDWKNYFTTEAAKVYDEYAGDLLIELEYESDPEWARQKWETP